MLLLLLLLVWLVLPYSSSSSSSRRDVICEDADARGSVSSRLQHRRGRDRLARPAAAAATTKQVSVPPRPLLLLLLLQLLVMVLLLFLSMSIVYGNSRETDSCCRWCLHQQPRWGVAQDRGDGSSSSSSSSSSSRSAVAAGCSHRETVQQLLLMSWWQLQQLLLLYLLLLLPLLLHVNRLPNAQLQLLQQPGRSPQLRRPPLPSSSSSRSSSRSSPGTSLYGDFAAFVGERRRRWASAPFPIAGGLQVDPHWGPQEMLP